MLYVNEYGKKLQYPINLKCKPQISNFKNILNHLRTDIKLRTDNHYFNVVIRWQKLIISNWDKVRSKCSEEGSEYQAVELRIEFLLAAVTYIISTGYCPYVIIVLF